MTTRFNKLYEEIIQEEYEINEMFFKPKVAIITTLQDVADELNKIPIKNRIIKYLYITNPSNEQIIKRDLKNYLNKSRKISTQTHKYTPTTDKEEYVKIDINDGYKLFKKIIQNRLDLLSGNLSTNFSYLKIPNYVPIL